MRSPPNLAQVRRRLEHDTTLLRLGPEAVLYAILDAVVDGYAPVVSGLENDIDEIETEVFGGDPAVSRRIYELSREVIGFQRATHPLTGILDALAGGFTKYGIAEDLQQYLRDVADHTAQANERIDGFRFMLWDILTVNATLVAQSQNEEMKHLAESSNAQNEEVKKISAWAAIPFAAHPRGHRLRHELREHARTPVGVRLSALGHFDGRRQHHPVPDLQKAQLDLGQTLARPV
jgi:magnesium transporter